MFIIISVRTELHRYSKSEIAKSMPEPHIRGRRRRRRVAVLIKE